MNNKITIKKEDAGKRLDKFLVEMWPTHSRSQIQKMIKEGLVLVNGKKATVHKWLKAGDKLKVEEKKINTTKTIPSKTNQPLIKKINYQIITETKDYLVVEKPAGVVVHEDAVHKNSLIGEIIKKYPEIKKVGDNPERPGIVHRLDKEVSGLLLIARHEEAFEYFKKQFKERKIKKEYIALVYGEPEKEYGEIDFPIERGKGGKMAAKPKGSEGKRALTEFEIQKKFINYTLLKIKIKTGRTHQIRVHLNAYGHPIVGDNLYKPKKLKSKIDISRIFLHAETLGFYDMAGEWQEFHSPLPQELKNILNELK